MKIKDFSQACFEIRKRYGRAYLSKKQLSEAFTIYIEAKGNKKKFKELLTKMGWK